MSIEWNDKLSVGSDAIDGFECTVKLRSTSPSVAVNVTPMEDDRAQIQLKEPFAGVAPGQACVFYDGERLLGGGWIEKA